MQFHFGMMRIDKIIVANHPIKVVPFSIKAYLLSFFPFAYNIAANRNTFHIVKI